MAAREKKVSNASESANEEPKRYAPVGDERATAQFGAAKGSAPSKPDTGNRGLTQEKRDMAPTRAGAGAAPLSDLAEVGAAAISTDARAPLVGRMLAKGERKSEAIDTRLVEMQPVSTPVKPGTQPGGMGVTTTSASAEVVKSGTDTGSTLSASLRAVPQKLAAPKAAPASAKSDRDEQNGDQKAMKTNANRHGFKLNEFVVYPAHGVGQIVSMEEQEVAGFKLELFVINFVKDKMTLRVPTSKVAAVGMRKLSDTDAARRSLEILTGRARVKRTMWSRRAQEYEAKINSGDINAIAEVVRDLFRSDAQPEQSYSERQLYEAALDRMMREIAAVHKLTETEALKMIEGQLKKNVKRAPKTDAAGGEAEAEDADIEEAA